MIRNINIILIVAIALQTIGCSAWQPLARVNEITEEKRQASMKEQVLEKLKEGMRVKLRIRPGTRAPITGRVFECVIERIGLKSLTVIPFASFARSDYRREFALGYADIVSIEIRSGGNSTDFVGGGVVGLLLSYILIFLLFRG